MTFLNAGLSVLFAVGSLRQPNVQRQQQQCVKPTALFAYPQMNTMVVDLDVYESMLLWLRGSTDAFINDALFIEESKCGVGYGAFVSKDVKEGELLFEVPRKGCVTIENAIGDPECGRAFKKIIEKAGPGGSTVVLAAYLAKEYLVMLEREDITWSKIGPYLQTLPWERGFNNQEHILFWSDLEVEHNLKESFCYTEAVELRTEVEFAVGIINGIIGNAIRRERGEIKPERTGGFFRLPWDNKEEEDAGPPVDKKKIVDGLDQAVRGAFVSLLTRSFQDEGIKGDNNNNNDDDDDENEKLVPILDMLQHSDVPNVSHVMRKVDGTVEVRARKDISAGEELVNQYRSEQDENMPAHRFFTRFGFVPGATESPRELFEDKSSVFYPKIEQV